MSTSTEPTFTNHTPNDPTLSHTNPTPDDQFLTDSTHIDPTAYDHTPTVHT